MTIWGEKRCGITSPGRIVHHSCVRAYELLQQVNVLHRQELDVILISWECIPISYHRVHVQTWWWMIIFGSRQIGHGFPHIFSPRYCNIKKTTTKISDKGMNTSINSPSNNKQSLYWNLWGFFCNMITFFLNFQCQTPGANFIQKKENHPEWLNTCSLIVSDICDNLYLKSFPLTLGGREGGIETFRNRNTFHVVLYVLL